MGLCWGCFCLNEEGGEDEEDVDVLVELWESEWFIDGFFIEGEFGDWELLMVWKIKLFICSIEVFGGDGIVFIMRYCGRGD